MGTWLTALATALLVAMIMADLFGASTSAGLRPAYAQRERGETDAQREWRASPAVAEERPVAEEQLVELPPSLADTEVDGALEVDAAGRFQATAEALRLFDYFLTGLGEIDQDGVRRLVAAEAEAVLGADQVDAVVIYLDRYLAYRERLHQLSQRAAPGTSARGFFALVVAEQQAWFGADADRLFADENAVAAAVLERAGE